MRRWPGCAASSPSSSWRATRSASRTRSIGATTATAIGELEALVGRDPTRERSWGLLASAFIRCGRQADALDALARAKRALAIELGIEPGPHLRQLEQAVLGAADSVGCCADWPARR